MTVSRKRRCNLCNHSRFLLVKDRLRDDSVCCKVFRCQSCGHLQLLPRPGELENKLFYDRNLQDKNRKKSIRYARLKMNNSFDTLRHVRMVERMFADRTIRIGDIGCGYGFFVDSLYRAGFRNVVGMEISSQRRAIARRHTRAAVIDYDVNRPRRDIGRFDCLTLFHVLEHLADPVGFLVNCRTLLNPGGVLLCEVPNVQELLLEACPAYNDFYWIRAHLNYFNGTTLRRCITRAGFTRARIGYVQRYGLDNLMNWLNKGEPQIERPVFELKTGCYRPVEDAYRSFLESRHVSDAIIAEVRR